MTLPEPLKTVVELEQLHHEWYLTTKVKTNNVRHVEWLLERTTCIQKELAKWMSMCNPRSVLTWGYLHVDEEIGLLESDLRDIHHSVLSYRPSEEPMLENPEPTKEIADMVHRMIRMSAEIRQTMRKWGDEHRDDPSAQIVSGFFERTGVIQSALLREIATYPTNVRHGLENAYKEVDASVRELRVLQRSIFRSGAD